MLSLPKMPSSFVDPITGYPPNNEVQMSGLLGLFHQLGRIDWSVVPLALPTGETAGIHADELFTNSVVCTAARVHQFYL